MRFFHKTLLVITLLLLGHSVVKAEPFTPESGFWWNPDEPGSGYAIEIQDNFLFVALYVYDELGNPIWYTAGASLTGQGGNSFFDTELNFSFNGTCIDCGFTEPTTIIGERGPITIDFLTETTATIQFQGAIKNIERFNFILGDEIESMLGEWQTIIDFSSIRTTFPYDGDILIFNTISISGGNKFATGCRPDNSIVGACSEFSLINHGVEASYDFQNNELIIVVDDTPNSWLVYYLVLGLDQFDGVAESFLKEVGNNNIYYPVRGFRTGSRTYIETGQGPSKNIENKEIVGIHSRLGFELPKKEITSFSKEEQIKILRRQTIVKTMINKLEKIKNQDK